jgi:tetratricopeptide (TPR) repeat protein
MGKTALLDCIARADVGHYRCALVDVDQVIRTFSDPARAGDDVALSLLREIALALAKITPWWQRRLLRARASRLGARVASTRVLVRQRADRGGAITGSGISVTIGGDRPASARRLPWVGELAAVVARMRHRRVLLLLDTTEWLRYLDDAQRERPIGGDPVGVGGWFADEVLTHLLRISPRLRVVLAGQEPIMLHRLNSDQYAVHELKRWTDEHTRSYLAAWGLTDRNLATAAHTACEGVPVLTWLLAEALAHEPDPDLISVVRQRPLQQWVPQHLLTRWTDEQHAIFQAAAVLRVITEPGLGALLAERQLSLGWFERARQYQLLRELPGPDGYVVLRMHPIPRAWLLAELQERDWERPRPERQLPRLHRLAAAFHEQLAEGRFSLEATYHRFALEDATATEPWLAHLHAALDADEPDQALLLADAATEPEIASTVQSQLPAAYAAARRTQALVARRQGRLALALQYAEAAATGYQLAEDTPGLFDAHVLEGHLAWRTWKWPRALDAWRQALELLPGLGQPRASARQALITAIAHAELGCGYLQGVEPRVTIALDLISVSTQLPEPDSARDEWPSVQPMDDLPDHLAARLLRLAGEACLHLGKVERAERLLLDALKGAAADPRQLHELVHTRRLQAELALVLGDISSALDCVSEAAELQRTCPDQTCRPLVLLTQWRIENRLAVCAPSVSASAQKDRHRKQASKFLKAAKESARDYGDQSALADILVAAGQADEALIIYREIGNRLGEAHAHLQLGDVARQCDEMESAAIHYQLAAQVFTDLELPRWADRATTGSLMALALRTDESRVVHAEEEQAVADIEALTLTHHFLQSGFNPTDSDEKSAPIVLARSSPVVREQIYLEASAQRSENWTWRSRREEDPLASIQMMRLHDGTIPLLRALVKAFPTDSRFRGELGFALKDQGEPEQEEALWELTEALTLCADVGEASWYHLNRALLLISMQSISGDRSLAPIIEGALQRASAANQTIARIVQNDDLVREWRLESASHADTSP